MWSRHVEAKQINELIGPGLQGRVVHTKGTGRRTEAPKIDERVENAGSHRLSLKLAHTHHVPEQRPIGVHSCAKSHDRAELVGLDYGLVAPSGPERDDR